MESGLRHPLSPTPQFFTVASWQGEGQGVIAPPLNVGLSEKMSENVLLVGQFSSKNAKGGLKTPIWGEI